ncbi:MAG: hypothetical protein K9L95_05535, partial [Candidatus Omnitrophica bacterium]|nr:hypothetical protein [Candidatus Omnitrophota bacterium]
FKFFARIPAFVSSISKGETMPGQRKSIRLMGYDYAQRGAYFITICVNNRKCLFGNVCDGEMILNECGKIIDKCWNQIPQYFPHVELDEYIIMPNHIHGIINIVKKYKINNVGGTPCGCPE